MIKSSDLDAMTVPATFISAISLAKLGPLKTPTLFVLLKQRCSLIRSVIVLKGSFFIPLVQEMICTSSVSNGLILITIVSNIELGVAIKIIFAFFTTSSRRSDAFIFSDNLNSG